MQGRHCTMARTNPRAMSDDDFNKDESTAMIASTPNRGEAGLLPHVVVEYTLHRAGKDSNILAGSAVLSSSGGLCTPCEACPKRNLFRQFFGIKFHHDGHTCVRAISTFECARCFNLVDCIQYLMTDTNWIGCVDACQNFGLGFLKRFYPILSFCVI
jgi:hypothetical protein